ncbi:putative membrane protein [Phenylobacterium koreense]|uniref:Membrane protein n=2 Tax=Caulobacteraceae TaxID=76892 RepID=A0ABV2EGZ1_9CAUL
MHLTVAITVAYALTRDWRAALAIGMIEPIFQTLAFAIHERVWARITAHGTGSPAAASVEA